jgi:hypothetical protein
MKQIPHNSHDSSHAVAAGVPASFGISGSAAGLSEEVDVIAIVSLNSRKTHFLRRMAGLGAPPPDRSSIRENPAVVRVDPRELFRQTQSHFRSTF